MLWNINVTAVPTQNVPLRYSIMIHCYRASYTFVMKLLYYPFSWKSKYVFFSHWLFSLYGLLSKSESVKFSLIESVICLFTNSSVKKYFSLLNQSIYTEIISEIWLIYSNLFLAICISQILLIISRFWLIQI